MREGDDHEVAFVNQSSRHVIVWLVGTRREKDAQRVVVRSYLMLSELSDTTGLWQGHEPPCYRIALSTLNNFVF